MAGLDMPALMIPGGPDGTCGVGPRDPRWSAACDGRVRPAGPGGFFSEHGFGPTTTY